MLGQVVRRRADNPAQGPVRDPLSVGEAAPHEDSRLAADLLEERVPQPGLADSGLSEDGHELQAAVGRGRVEGCAQSCKLRPAVDQRRIELPLDTGAVGADFVETA